MVIAFESVAVMLPVAFIAPLMFEVVWAALIVKLPVTLRVFSSFIEPLAPCSSRFTVPEEPASKSFVPTKRISCAVPAAEVDPPKVMPPWL